MADWRRDLVKRRDGLAEALYATRWGVRPASPAAAGVWLDHDADEDYNYKRDANDILLGDKRAVLLRMDMLEGLIRMGFFEDW